MKIKITNEKVFMRNIIILVLLLIIVLIPKGNKTYTYREQNYLVHDGDTLWDIALQNKYPDEDTRDYIDKVCKLNNDFSKNLTSGQSVTILVHD